MGVERYGSKTDVVVKLVLVFFIALLSFSIGTFVGKKFSDNQHKLSQLEPGAHGDSHGKDAKSGHGESRDVASVHPEAGEVKPEKALTDDEIAKLAEEFVTDDEKTGETGTKHDKSDHSPASAHSNAAHGTEKHAAPAHAAPTPRAATAKDTAGHDTHAAPAPAAKTTTPAPAASKPAARMAEGHSPVVENPKPVVSRIPSALPKEVASSAIGQYTVQVAAYPTEKEAQAMAAELKGKGFSAFYVSAKVKGKTWYRVSVGLFTTANEADAYKKDLVTRKKVSSAIVQKITSAD